MKKFLSILGASLICAAVASGQTNVNPTSPAGAQAPATKAAALSELEESIRLSESVGELFNAGKYDEALPLAKHAIELREKILGIDHPSLVPFLSNLGEIYIAKRKFDDALPLFQRALAISENKFGAEHLNVSAPLLRLAALSFVKGHKDQAELFYQRALAIREKALGMDDVKVGDVVYSLAEFYRNTGQYKKGEPLFERAIAIRGKALGIEHPDFIKTVEKFGCLFYQNRQGDATKEWMKRKELILKPFTKEKVETGGILNGKAISLPKPDYPVEAKQGHYGGMVQIKVTIDEAGKVTSAVDVCGSNLYLFKAARDSALDARFSPTKLNGQAVKVTGIIIYNFLAQ